MLCLTTVLRIPKSFLRLSSRYVFLIVVSFVSFLNNVSVYCQQRSVALKDTIPARIIITFKSDLITDRLWDGFMLMKDANSGDPVAEHELGLRYLLGKGFPADTAKAVVWIKKAADQNLLPAQYNMGILLNSGIGVVWDPFDAYKRFQYAAIHGMTEAQYVYGLLFTDNLTVTRNYSEALHWITLAADSGYAPAKEVLEEFRTRGLAVFIDSARTYHRDTRSKRQTKKSGLQQSTIAQTVLIDSTADSVTLPPYSTLVHDALREKTPEVKNSSDDQKPDSSKDDVSAEERKRLFAEADAGSPEALTLIGRWYEEGRGIEKSILQATYYYLRAVRLESPWAPKLLWNMIQANDYFIQLKKHVDNNEPLALFGWAGLDAFGFDRQLAPVQIMNFYESAAVQNFSPAFVELGVNYYNGSLVKRDKAKALGNFKRAAQLGNREANIRLMMMSLTEGTSAGVSKQIIVDSLKAKANEGSVLAQALLGYCYQKGIGTPVSKARAVHWYREAAQRGSTVAYNALKNLYDDLRPKEDEFQVDN